MDVLFLISIFRLYPGFKMSFEHNSVRKNLFLSACFCWVSSLSLHEMDQKLKFGGLIGYGNSFLASVFRYSKIFRLYAILRDTAGAVRAHTGKRPGYFYMIGRGPSSGLLGHVTGLLFCLYVKLFLHSIFDSVDFWSSMSCIVLDIELADKNVIEELGVFIVGKVQGYSFRPQKSTNPRNKPFGAQKNLHGIVWNNRRLDYSEPSNNLPEGVKGKYFAKGTELWKTFRNLMDREVENLEDHGCPKVQDLVDEEIGSCSKNPFRHKTLSTVQSLRQHCLVAG